MLTFPLNFAGISIQPYRIFQPFLNASQIHKAADFKECIFRALSRAIHHSQFECMSMLHSTGTTNADKGYKLL